VQVGHRRFSRRIAHPKQTPSKARASLTVVKNKVPLSDRSVPRWERDIERVVGQLQLQDPRNCLRKFPRFTQFVLSRDARAYDRGVGPDFAPMVVDPVQHPRRPSIVWGAKAKPSVTLSGGFAVRVNGQRHAGSDVRHRGELPHPQAFGG
jgi:hypothetical protein